MYKPCWPGKNFSPYRTIYLYRVYSVKAIRRTLNSTLLKTGHRAGPNEIDTLEEQQTEKIETEKKDVNRI